MKKNQSLQLPHETPLTDAEKELLQRLNSHLVKIGYDPTDPNVILDFPRKVVITSIRLTYGAKSLLKKLVEYHGISQTAIIELAIREKAQRDGLMEPPHEPTTKTTTQRRTSRSR